MPEFALIVEVISGLLIFIYAGYTALIKIFGDIGIFKKKKEEREAKEKKKREKEYKKYLEDASKEILDPIVERIKKTDEEQNKRLDKLIQSSNDMLRKEITKIYYKYLPYKALPRFVKEELVTMYTDYRQQNGNSYVEEIFEEMRLWNTVNTEEDLKIIEIKISDAEV